MADKFTRLATAEGDILYATTAGGSKSIESLEDNIDAKMLAFIGTDAVGGSINSSVTETKIAEVIVPANSLNTNAIILAALRFNGVSGSGGTFRIRTGTSATATSNTERESASFNVGDDNSTLVGGMIAFCLTSSQEVFTSQFYVHVTGQNDTSNATTQSYCDSLIVLGA